MTEQEQIEEMANCNPCYERYGKCPMKDKTTCTDWTRAVNRYEQNYRKIPEGSVVLTKDEYKKLKALPEKVHDEMEERMKEEVSIEKRMGYKIAEKVRKETAREILQKMKEKCKELEDKFSHICKSKKECLMETCRYEGVLAVKKELYELSKEYSIETVEVEE